MVEEDHHHVQVLLIFVTKYVQEQIIMMEQIVVLLLVLHGLEQIPQLHILLVGHKILVIEFMFHLVDVVHIEPIRLTIQDLMHGVIVGKDQKPIGIIITCIVMVEQLVNSQVSIGEVTVNLLIIRQV